MKKITLLISIFMTTLMFGQDKLTSSIEENFDGSNWVNSSKNIYIYDANKNLIEQEYEYWDNTNSSWISGGKETYTYNNSNKIVTETYESSGYGYKTIYTYNASNQITVSIGQELENNIWVNNYRTIYVYTDNKLAQFDDQNWNGTSWVFVAKTNDQDASSRYSISYGANGLVSQALIQEWNGSSWGNSGKQDYTYNGNNKFLKNIQQKWNGTSYENSFKEEFTYDANGNLILEDYLEYANGTFQSLDKTNYTFDTTKSLSNFAHPFKDRQGFDALLGQDNKFVNKIVGSSRSSENRTTYYYGNEPTASVNKFDAIEFSVNPNPTSSILNIDDSKFTLKNVELYNIIGKRVLNSTKNKINIENLENGVYLLKVQSEDGNFATKKIIKN